MPFPYTLRLVSRRRETPDTWTQHFETPSDFLPKAGQFVCVNVPARGATRCWTLSSTPGVAPGVDITVRCCENGLCSPWMTKELPVGSEIRVSAPTGDFVLDEQDPGPFLFVTAGIGITPAASLIRQILIELPGTPVTLVYCVRNQASIVFDKELRTLAACRPEFTFLPLVKEDPLPGAPTGRLDAAKLLELVPDVANRTVYTCGSAVFMDNVARWARELGAAPERVHVEAMLP